MWNSLNELKEKIRDEFRNPTETMRENEIQANYFVSRILLYTIVVALFFLTLAALGILSIDRMRVIEVMSTIVFLCMTGYGVNRSFEGNKPWLKVFLLMTYVLIYMTAESVLGFYAYFIAFFPIAVSVRYYSGAVTTATAFMVVLFSGFADFQCLARGMGYPDLNFAILKEGSVLSGSGPLMKLIMAGDVYDREMSWSSYFLNGYVPKMVFVLFFALICIVIAEKGREVIRYQQDETKRTERISTELNLASSIQADMLPNIFPAFPEREDFDIYASMKPAKEVGGDFYDFFMTDDDHLAMVIADVSGKGVPAAMFMVIAKTLIKDHTQLGLTPSMVFTRVNDILCEGNKAGLFVTAWMGILDLTNGEFLYANAGHNPPILMKDGKLMFLHSKPGFVLAGLEGYEYKESMMFLHKGDKLFLYTDGVTEAENTQEELYGENRLMNCIKKLDKADSCADAVTKVRADLEDFVGEAEQFDDITMLAFAYTETEHGHSTMERTFDADAENLHEVISFVEEAMEEHDVGMKDSMAVTVSLEEIFVNICNYAYPDHKGKATVGMRFDEDQMEVYLIDSGIPFNPLEKEDPNVHAKLADRKVGGLGIYMVKKSMDDCVYERKGNQNCFRMTRKYSKPKLQGKGVDAISTGLEKRRNG